MAMTTIASSARDATATLEAARFPDATIAEVQREIQVINGEILDRAARPAIGYAVKGMPC